MATLGLTFLDLYSDVSKNLGTYGSSGPAGTDLTDAKGFVHKGIRKFLNAFTWSFLRKEASLAVGPSNWQYQLPEDFLHMVMPFTFGPNTVFPPMEERAYQQILEMRSELLTSSYPQVWAVYAADYNVLTGQRWEAAFWPTPQQQHVFYYRYKFMPDKLENDTDIPIGPLDAHEAIRLCCLAAGEEEEDDTSGGVQGLAAQREIGKLIEADKRRYPAKLGYNFNGYTLSQRELARGSYRVNDVTYNV